MPRGDKSSYTDKQKRQAAHIEEGSAVDGGCVAIKGPSEVKGFLDRCADLRFWEREANVHAI